jgi:hypothetical protein
MFRRRTERYQRLRPNAGVKEENGSTNGWLSAPITLPDCQIKIHYFLNIVMNPMKNGM